MGRNGNGSGPLSWNGRAKEKVSGSVDHDLIIIGGGAGGLAAARAARRAHADVLLVNDGPLGGDCTFTGCVPSKTLLASSRDGLEFGPAMERVRGTIARIAATETADVLRSEGVDVIDGRASVATHDTIVVDARRITAPRIIIATGSRAVVASIPGIDSVDVLTNETVFGLTERPVSLGIVGGGAIGCEMAQALSRLGIDVTIFEVARHLLPREEPEAGAAVESALAGGGVTVRTAQSIVKVAPTDDGSGIEVTTAADKLSFERIFLAVGRAPNSSGMGLDGLGVKFDQRGFIQTDDRLATAVRGIYAVGDVTGRLPFTHAADEMGRLATGNALKQGPRGRFRASWIPWVTFTDPEVAHIGMTEAEAADHGGLVAELPITELDRAVTDGYSEGFVKLIAGPRRLLRRIGGGQVIGATIVAPRAGEMIHEVAVAMRTNMFTGRLAQTVHAYPTWSYGIQKAAAQFFGEVEGRTARPARRH